MSVIICATTSDFGIMMADSRLIENGVPVNENYIKIHRINDRLIFGAGGIAVFGELLLNNVILPDNFCGCSNDVIFNDVYEQCSKIAEESDGSISSYFFFLENNNGSVQIRGIKISDNKVEIFAQASKHKDKFAYAIGANGHTEEIKRIVENDLPELISGLNNGIRYIASIDDTVNTVTRFLATGISKQFNVLHIAG